MRLYLICLLFFMWNYAQPQTSVRFEVSDFPSEESDYLGIRGSVAPLSWERSIFLKKEAGANPFIELEFAAGTELVEYKFVLDKKGKVQWEGIQNRAEYIQGDSLEFSSIWNKDKFIDPATLPLLSVKELEEDYQVVADVIQQIHPGLYRYNDSAAVKKAMAELKASFESPKTYGEAFLRMAKFAAAIQCDHTYASLWNQEAIITSLLHRQKDKLPLTFEWINRRMLVTHNASEAQAIQRGTEILQINGIFVEEILETMLPYISSDGGLVHNKISKVEIEGYGFRYSGFDALYGLLFPVKEGKVKLDFRNPDGSEQEAWVETLTREEREEILLNRYPTFPAGPQDLWSYDIVDEQVGYLKIGSFDTDNFSKDWRGILKDAFKSFDKAQVKNLVLDIRENQGGLDDAGAELVKYLSQKTCEMSPWEAKARFLTFPEEVKPHVKTWDYWFYNLPKQTHEKRGIYYVFPEESSELSLKASSKSFEGNIFLLTSSQNVSGAFYLAHKFRACDMGMIVGQETGGNQRGLNGGSILFLKPPNSRINIDLPIMGIFSKKEMPNRGVVPDVVVEKSVEAFQKGVDLELEQVLSLIKKQKDE